MDTTGFRPRPDIEDRRNSNSTMARPQADAIDMKIRNTEDDTPNERVGQSFADTKNTMNVNRSAKSDRLNEQTKSILRKVFNLKYKKKYWPEAGSASVANGENYKTPLDEMHGKGQLPKMIDHYKKNVSKHIHLTKINYGKKRLKLKLDVDYKDPDYKKNIRKAVRAITLQKQAVAASKVGKSKKNLEKAKAAAKKYKAAAKKRD